MDTWGVVQCFLIFLVRFFHFAKMLFQKLCMEAINWDEERCNKDHIWSEGDKPFCEEFDARKWQHIDGRWILIWPRSHRPKDLKQSRHQLYHRSRKLAVKKTKLEVIPEGIENIIETNSDSEPEPNKSVRYYSYRRGIFRWLHAPCLDGLENKPKHSSSKVHNMPRQHELLQTPRARRFKNLFLGSFGRCIGRSPVD